jgi:HSP20 family protein
MQEIPEGRFIRTFRLPTYVDQHRASAVHKNGLLTVTLPKREEAKLRRITIEG